MLGVPLRDIFEDEGLDRCFRAMNDEAVAARSGVALALVQAPKGAWASTRRASMRW